MTTTMLITTIVDVNAHANPQPQRYPTMEIITIAIDNVTILDPGISTPSIY